MSVKMLSSFIFFALVHQLVNGDKPTKNLGNVLQNTTKLENQTNLQKHEEDILKKEAHKLVYECGGEDTSQTLEDTDRKTENKGKTRRNNNMNSQKLRPGNNENNNYNNGRGEQNRHGNDESGYEDWRQIENSGKRPNRNKLSMNHQRGGNQDGCGGDNREDNNDRKRHPYNEDSWGYNRERTLARFVGTYPNYEPMGYSPRRVLDPGPYSNLRSKRFSTDDDGAQCISQCVFGYLDVLDDDRVPSETLVIKWLQDNIPNNMKRMRAFREARRCFARMSTTDSEDGCELSQTLSKCLNLNLQ